MERDFFDYLADLQLFAGEVGAVGDEGADDGRGGTSVTGGASSVSSAGDSDGGSREASDDEEFERLIKGRYKDAYTKRTQKIINKRFREEREGVEFRERAAPVIEALFEKYGIENGDLEALRARVVSGSAPAENPVGGVDGETKNTDAENGEAEVGKASASAERVRTAITDSRRRAAAKSIYDSWVSEGEALCEYYPSFELSRECGEPAFCALLSAGVSVRDAYEAVHHRELLSGAMRYTAKRVSDSVWQSVLSGSSRPSENGLSSRGTSFEKKSASSFTDRDIKAILRRVEKGEKVRF